MRIHIDFETFCALDIRKVGLYNYVDHPTFRVTLTALAFHDDPEIHQNENLPEWLEPYLVHPDVNFHAFNARFEAAVLRRYGYDIPPDRWHCTMTHAYERGFSGGLADIGQQVGLPLEMCKRPDGQRLITKFCMPRKPTKNNPARFNDATTHPDDWKRFRDYNRQDVVAEREVYQFLSRHPETEYERRVWAIDWEINRRGIPIDIDLATKGAKYAREFEREINAECSRATGGIEATQVSALLRHVQTLGSAIENLQASTIDQALEGGGEPPEVREILQMRRDVSQAASKKMAAVARVAHQGRVHDAFQLCGASRTGRWGGRVLQPQNLKRPVMRTDPASVADVLSASESFEEFARVYSFADLGDLARSMITAPDGQNLVVADYSSIEARVLGWMARCEALNAIFRDGKDPYKDFATHWLGKPYEEISKLERNLSKPPSLGCGYGLGPPGLVSYASSMGVSLSRHEAESAVKTFRSVYWEVPVLWRNVETAFRRAMGGEPSEAGRCFFDREDLFVTIRLPSGRKLWYYQPLEDEDGEITYLGKNQYTNQWTRLRTWGAKTVENIDQAISSDLLRDALVSCEDKWLNTIGHVHDEVIAEAPESEASIHLAALIKIMSTPPGWAPGLLLDAHGYTARRYRKD